MLGFEGTGVFLAYILSIGAGILCVVYGITNWNKPANDAVELEINEEMNWEKSDPENEEKN